MLNLTADNLPRVMQCTGSLFMNPAPLPEVSNTTQQEGIAADWVIQQVYKTGQMPETFVDRKADNGVFISGEMVENLADYLAARNTADKIEVSSEIGDGKTWRVGCRADRQRRLTANGEDTLYTDDFKYGFSIIEANMNWSLIAHACAFVQNSPAPYPTNFVFTIYQPRAFHPKGKIRAWTISFAELEKLYAQLQYTLLNPQMILTTGENCRNCAAMHGCPSATKAGMNAVDVSTVAYVDNISNPDLSLFLDTIDRAKTMIKQLKKAYEGLAQHRISLGQVVPNYSLERQQTNRKFHDFVTVDYIKALTGVDVAEKLLPTPAEAERRGVSKDIMKMLADKHESGTKLTRIDDSEKAKKLFNQPKGN